MPVEVAVQLAASAEAGDEIAMGTLLEAAEALVTTDPGTAAQFGQRALEIATSHHPQRGALVGITAIALHIAGKSEEAIAFADPALREILPSDQEAEVRLRIAGMFAISAEIRIASGRAALKLPELPQVLRARHLACLFHNLVVAERIGDARTCSFSMGTDRVDPGCSCVLHAAGRRERARIHRRPLRLRAGADHGGIPRWDIRR